MVLPLVGKSRLSRSDRCLSAAGRSQAPSLRRTLQVSALTLDRSLCLECERRFSCASYALDYVPAWVVRAALAAAAAPQGPPAHRGWQRRETRLLHAET